MAKRPQGCSICLLVVCRWLLCALAAATGRAESRYSLFLSLWGRPGGAADGWLAASPLQARTRKTGGARSLYFFFAQALPGAQAWVSPLTSMFSAASARGLVRTTSARCPSTTQPFCSRGLRISQRVALRISFRADAAPLDFVQGKGEEASPGLWSLFACKKKGSLKFAAWRHVGSRPHGIERARRSVACCLCEMKP